MQQNESKESIPLTEGSLDALQSRLAHHSATNSVTNEVDQNAITHDRSVGEHGARLWELPILLQAAEPSPDARSLASNPSSISYGSIASSRTIGSFHSCVSRSSRVTKASYTSSTSRKSRKGVRKWERSTPQIELMDFYCTFCWKGFKTRYSWRRHEDEGHARLTSYVCNNGLPTYAIPCYCPYCPNDTARKDCPINNLAHRSTSTPDREKEAPLYFAHESLTPAERAILDDHLQAHNHTNCMIRPLSDRTFLRKEHLFQHLRWTHRVDCSNVDRLAYDSLSREGSKFYPLFSL